MSEYHGEEAVEKAKELGYKGDQVELINKVVVGPRRCVVAWSADFAECITCGDVWFDNYDEED